jgi:class 3 adenylate cyclase
LIARAGGIAAIFIHYYATALQKFANSRKLPYSFPMPATPPRQGGKVAKSASAIGPARTPHQILVELMDRVIAGELRSFSDLKAQAPGMTGPPLGRIILRKVFGLQRRLYWGFFRDLDPVRFKSVWGQVVIQDPDFDFAGDLKGYMSIPDIYVGLLDIHGYTRYCHENRKNMSMLDRLDRMIHEDVWKITTKNGVLSRRSRGDEILLLSASARDLADMVVEVMDFFSRKRRIQEEASEAYPAFDLILPPFEVSAGIAGGQKYTPLVITRDGDLSGDIVNTAARLQARANKLSPNHNRLLVTSHVHQKIAGTPVRQGATCEDLRFLNTGTIEFKGVSLTVYDAILSADEEWRLEIQGELKELYDSLNNGMWRSKVFEDTLRLAARLVLSISRCEAARGTADSTKLWQSQLLTLIRSAKEDFAGGNFEAAVTALVRVGTDLAGAAEIDAVALEYIKTVGDGYKEILASFVESLDAEIGSHPDEVFSPTAKATFETLRKHASLFERAVENARHEVRSRKATWFRAADQAAPAMGVRIESRK